MHNIVGIRPRVTLTESSECVRVFELLVVQRKWYGPGPRIVPIRVRSRSKGAFP